MISDTIGEGQKKGAALVVPLRPLRVLLVSPCLMFPARFGVHGGEG